MLRSLTFLFAVVIPCSATQIDASVNCAGAKQSTVSLLPGIGPDLTCNQDGVQAGAIGAIFRYSVFAEPFPENRQAPPGNVQASLTIKGFINLAPFPTSTVAAFYVICFSSPSFGNASISGFFGPAVAGTPCDFAHALPDPTGGAVTFPVDITITAQGERGPADFWERGLL